ncbi:AAA family ATPase [Roseisalinus antarcticus]|uniref:Sporulation initiation inhibitor protein Soj n=1 Tax=Roseisalinus antarcticus TaxID=254357 RepID=A0A1Y5SXE2_9RHOB|nr:AAA family ATPase [Roseisalinus antarcticus]SLN50705.1 Sporulation initiation inhibitor protein Soj [Roseisalinus antarcticus]
MTSNAVLQPEAQPIVACTISRDVQIFDLLIEDMETALGESWGDLGFTDALAFLEQPEANELQFVCIALDEQDEADLSLIIDIIAAAKARNVKVIIVAEDVSPASLHQLLREGGNEFVPYPLPENELSQAIDRVLAPPAEATIPERQAPNIKAEGDRNGVVIPIHGMAGGTGSTTLAVNLAWELATIDAKNAPRVCLLDLDLQFGSASTYLDLPRREAVFELLSDTEAMDGESFIQALMTYDDKLHVLTAPSELIPLDLVTSDDVRRVIDMARANFDYVIIDMPTTMVEWSQAALDAAHVYFAMIEMDMRSAQNTLRIKRALQAEDLPFSKFRFVLNRGPKFTDLSGKARVKRLADSLGISIEVQLPDGSREVTQINDQGVPLAVAKPKNPLRKEIAKLAAQVHEVNHSEAVKKG